MSFFRWLCVVFRLAGEAVILGFTFHHAHWSVALTLTGLTANMEWEAFMKHLQKMEENLLTERQRMIERLRNIY
jgi:hypothetical protein